MIRKLVISHVLPLELLNKCTKKNGYTPGNDRLHEQLRGHFKGLIPNDREYDEIFDRWEYLLALVRYDMSEQDGRYFGRQIGRFGWRNRDPLSPANASIVNILSAEHEKSGASWKPIVTGVFSSSERFTSIAASFNENVLSKFSPY